MKRGRKSIILSFKYDKSPGSYSGASRFYPYLFTLGRSFSGGIPEHFCMPFEVKVMRHIQGGPVVCLFKDFPLNLPSHWDTILINADSRVLPFDNLPQLPWNTRYIGGRIFFCELRDSGDVLNKINGMNRRNDNLCAIPFWITLNSAIAVPHSWHRVACEH